MRYFGMLKNWYKTARPKKGLLIAQFCTSILANCLIVVATIPAAKATSALAVNNYSEAYIWLIVALGLLLLRQVIWHLDYKIMPIQLRHIYTGSLNGIVTKVFNSDDQSIKLTSKEKIINTISSNVYNMGEFPNNLTTKVAYLVRALIMFIILISTDYIIGLIVISVITGLYFLLKAIHSKLGQVTKDIESNKDAVFEGFSDMMDSRVISSDLNIADQLEKDYESRTETLMKSYKKRRFLQSCKDNWVFGLWNVFATLATLFLVYKMQGGVYELTVYLIVTPYITSSLEFFCEFFNVFTEIETANVSANRVKTIYAMTEKELIEFGSNSTDKIEAKLEFKRVSCNPTKQEEGCSKIKNVSFKVNPGEIALIQGQRGSGKRTVFYLTRRAITPNSGRILIGDINIYEYERKSYVHNFSYVTSKPFYFNASVMENLKYLEPDEKKIVKACKKLGIHKLIEELPDGYNTNMILHAEAISEYLGFMIGLARVVLTKCEIVMIYEFPRLGREDTERVLESVKSIKEGHAIVIFSANDTCNSIADKHYVMSKGEISKIK